MRDTTNFSTGTHSLFTKITNGLTGFCKGEPLFSNSRLEYEKGEIPYSGKAVTLFPELGKKCIPEGFLPKKKTCLSGLYKIADDWLVKIQEETYNLADYSRLFLRHQITGKEPKLYKFYNDPHRLRLTNPGVTVMIMYSKNTSTTSQIIYKEDLQPYIDQAEFPPDTQIYNFGDVTVPSNSALIPGIKWAFDFEHQIQSSTFKVIGGEKFGI